MSGKREQLLRASVRSVQAMHQAADRFRHMFEVHQATPPDTEAYYALVDALELMGAALAGRRMRDEQVTLNLHNGKVEVTSATEFVKVEIIAG